MEVENVWLERLQQKEDTPSGWFSGTFEELSKKLLEFSDRWVDWILQLDENTFSEIFTYQNSLKQEFQQPLYEIVLHLFNHQTFHRGQIVSMFRQLGVDNIQPIDFIVFARGK